MMKELIVSRLDCNSICAGHVVALMDGKGVKYNAIDNVNWAKDYPYLPNVKFRIAHNQDSFLIHYKVVEQSIRAAYGEDDGDVWTDSCVEFFVQFDGEPQYYNLECSCIGTVLLGMGNVRNDRVRASSELTSQIDRWSSLGREPFGTINEHRCWQLALVVPKEVFCQSKIDALGGVTMRANFYKCGDELPVPHFVSWNEIEVAKPDFHLPQFFGKLVCEK